MGSARGRLSAFVLSLAFLAQAFAIGAPRASWAHLVDSTVELTGTISSYDERQVWFLVQKQVLLIPRAFVSQRQLDRAGSKPTRIALTLAQLEQCRFVPPRATASLRRSERPDFK